jgi:uroporphyrin-3 C-methyltransferase
MSNDSNVVPPSEAPAAAPAAATAASSSGSDRRPAIAVVAAVIALVGVVWLDGRMSQSALREEVARRVSDADAQAREARAVARQTQEALQALAGKVGGLETQLAESQSQQLALDAMYQELSRSRDERLVAEVEQAVAIAAQQLQLAGNVEAALIALAGADARLARAAQPQFLPMRKLITRDIERLRAAPTADVPGMAMKLEGVVAAIDAMPLAFEQRPAAKGGDAPTAQKKGAAAPAAPGFWERLGREAWADLRQMIRIERTDGGLTDPGLLSPQQAFFLRENLKLRLVSARLALLARDGRSFREDMRQAREWLERYFDGRAKPVQAALATVKALGGADVAVEPPRLDETLAALRSFKTARERGVPATTVARPAAAR